MKAETKAETSIPIDQKNRELAIKAAVAMHGQRAEDIVVLDLRKLIDYADFFVIASSASITRMRGITKAAEKAVGKAGGKRLNQPDRETGWALIDFGDILVHVFDAEARDFYRLEDLWPDAPRVEWRTHLPENAGKSRTPKASRK